MPEASNVQLEDYAELALFLSSFPGETRSAEIWLKRLRAWWDFNPAYVENFPRGWVLRDKGKIVGFFGSIPWKFQFAGKETTVFAGTTWRVLPEFRGMSMALKRAQMDQHKHALHFSTTPRPEVVNLLKLLRYKQIEREKSARHSLIVLNFEKLLRNRFRGKFPGAFLGKIFAPVLDACQSFVLKGFNRFQSDRVKDVPRADGSFDDLWERTKAAYANTNVRTAECINWYCFSIPENRKKLLAYYEGEKLLGYMIFFPSEMRGTRFFECVDSWIDPVGDKKNIVGALISKARLCAKLEGYDRIILPYFDSRTAALYKDLRLPERPEWKRSEYFKGPPEMMDEISAANSYFVPALGDYGL